MYYCLNCGAEVEKLKRVTERHGLDTPPYEIFPVCPLCESENVIKEVKCNYCNDIITDNFITMDGNAYCSKCYSEHSLDELYEE